MTDRPAEAVEAAKQEFVGYTGECVCHEAYTSRNLRDPECRYCDLLGIHEDILTAAYPHLRRAIIAELAGKAEAGSPDSPSAPRGISRWLRAELEGEK